MDDYFAYCELHWCRPYVMRHVKRLEGDYSFLRFSHRDMLPLYPSLLLTGTPVLSLSLSVRSFAVVFEDVLQTCRYFELTKLKALLITLFLDSLSPH